MNNYELQDTVLKEGATKNGEDTASQVAPIGPTPPQEISTARKCLLLILFSLSNFLDCYYTGSLYSAIPTLTILLDMSGGESIWLISAYQMLLACFLLISGRLSDVYNPKPVFVTGSTGIVILSIVAGFVQEKIGLIVLRAFLGIFAALTIPSALALIIYLFPAPKAQAGAIGVFGVSCAIGNVLGLVIGALLTEYVTWRWCFYFVAIGFAPVAIFSFLLIPNGITTGNAPKHLRGFNKLLSIDLFGIFLLTAGLILFTFSLIQATAIGWAEGGVLAPLFIGVLFVVLFFYWETKLPEGNAAIPPRVWSYPNFTHLFCLALLPYGFANIVFALFTPYWQGVFDWGNITFAVHVLPLGIASVFAMAIIAGPLARFITKKWFVIVGILIMMVAAILFIFANSPDRYWPFVFHTLIWGSCGLSMVYMHVNVSVFRCTPSHMAGTVGAIFNSALQLGTALGTAIVTSISQNVEAKQTGTDYQSKYAGAAAAFEFYAALLGLVALLTLLLYRSDVKAVESDADKNQTIEAEMQANKELPVP